jgi:hypothetical protein
MDELKIEDIIDNLNLNDDVQYGVRYEDLIIATGCDIIDSLRMGNYQGDLLMIVSKNYRFGILSTGFGSCPACDSLQACNSNSQRARLAKELHDSIVWKEPEKIIDYLENKDWEAEYYGRQKGLPEFIEKVKEQLIIRYLARLP